MLPYHYNFCLRKSRLCPASLSASCSQILLCCGRAVERVLQVAIQASLAGGCIKLCGSSAGPTTTSLLKVRQSKGTDARCPSSKEEWDLGCSGAQDCSHLFSFHQTLMLSLIFPLVLLVIVRDTFYSLPSCKGLSIHINHDFSVSR